MEVEDDVSHVETDDVSSFNTPIKTQLINKISQYRLEKLLRLRKRNKIVFF